MRQALLCLLMSLLTCHVLAQPVLTAATSVPRAGLAEQPYSNGVFLPGPAGAAQSWDFSAGSFTALGMIGYEACNAVNNCAPFPGTTVVGYNYSNGVTFSYYNGSASAFSLYGTSANNTNSIYTDPVDLYHFPFTYADNYTDTWRFSYTVSGYTTYRRGTDSVVADGWGMLKTPGGTYSNVLRIRRISNYQDSSYSGAPFIVIYRSVSYVWKDTAHEDVLYNTSRTISQQQGQTTTTDASGYFTELPTSVTPVTMRPPFDVQLQTNPATENATLFLTLPEPEQVTVTVMDMAGHMARPISQSIFSAGRSRIDISLANIPAGMYTLRVEANGEMIAKKLLVQ